MVNGVFDEIVIASSEQAPSNNNYDEKRCRFPIIVHRASLAANIASLDWVTANVSALALHDITKLLPRRRPSLRAAAGGKQSLAGGVAVLALEVVDANLATFKELDRLVAVRARALVELLDRCDCRVVRDVAQLSNFEFR